MEKELLQLAGILRDEIDLYDALIERLDRRTEILVENDIKALTGHNQASETLILKIKAQEDMLNVVLRSLSAEVGRAPETLTLSGLAEKINHPMARRLKGYVESLQDRMAVAERVNRRNALLFKHTLNYLQALGDLVIGTVSSYQSSGASQSPSLRTPHLSHEA